MKTDYTTFVRNRITNLRIKKNVSEYQMSYDLGHNRTYIHGIVSGKSLPSLKEFIFICEYFGITLKDFFDDGIEYPVLLNELIEEEKDLDEQNILTLLSLAKQLNARKSKK